MKELTKLILLGLISLNCYAVSHPDKGFTASNFVKLESDLDGLDIQVSAGSFDDVTYVTIENKSLQEAYCKVKFVNGPEPPKWTAKNVKPGATINLTHKARRVINLMKINLTCRPADADVTP
jgi:hypothetical protein